ncbi:hypothetical protein P3C22_01060, partial [Pseudomonas sp. ER28]|nr:hypothetical protein [Pseudomonas sp. ER28]
LDIGLPGLDGMEVIKRLQSLEPVPKIMVLTGQATDLYVRRDIAPFAKGIARNSPRNNWPETNVGASAARDAPRGRRSISQAPNIPRRAPAPPTHPD